MLVRPHCMGSLKSAERFTMVSLTAVTTLSSSVEFSVVSSVSLILIIVDGSVGSRKSVGAANRD